MNINFLDKIGFTYFLSKFKNYISSSTKYYVDDNIQTISDEAVILLFTEEGVA